jgi:hypothetical protein
MRSYLPILLAVAAVGVAVAVTSKMGPTGPGVWVGLTNGYRYEVQKQSDGAWSWWRYDAEWDIGERGSASSMEEASAAAIASAADLPPATGMAGTGVDSPLVPRCDTDWDDPNPSPPGCAL